MCRRHSVVGKERHRFPRVELVQSRPKAPSAKEFLNQADHAEMTVMRESHECWEGFTTLENSGIDAGTGDDNCELVVIVRNDTTRG
jgi:hypothetical protein